ncbi:tetratricopeptide repeat protein [Rhizohabitans arisaemae]|uniref:tetratricopeptide repeat protein n=1 Tax=Rhizohabitans arisaemae TaxID=2720610 RepID=UPI0024B0BCCA|nr:tetratricopeptide repeat protein [Rhizohabitans arisaemae]
MSEHAETLIGEAGRLWQEGRYEEAEILFARAAALGNPRALMRAGLREFFRDPDEAARLLRAAADTGSAEAMTLYAYQVLEEDQPNEAVGWYLKAAETGHAEAMHRLAVLLEADDPEAAVRWYREAVLRRWTPSMINLALLTKDRDRGEAERLLRTAAEKGMTDAVYDLGLLCQEDRRFEEAEQWYRRAIDGVDVDDHEDGDYDIYTLVMFNLGLLHEATDRPEEALRWYRRAALRGDARAGAASQRLSGTL